MSAGLLLTGCGVLTSGPSPTSTYTDAAGATIVVDWTDYPAHAGQGGEAMLGAPDQDGLEEPARELIEQLRTAVEQESGLALVPSEAEQSWFGDDDWHPQTGNGYGGESMLTTVNCCELQSDGVPAPARWDAVIDAASRVTTDAGLGAFVLDSETMDAEYRDRYCTIPDGGCWHVSASVFDGYQWVYLTIQDTSLDPSGDAAAEAEEFGWPLASIALGYGATVVRAGESADFARAMEPFLGLERPEQTTSD
ncbi:hypothetical protein [Microbacterium sp. NPDC055357]